MSKHVTRRDLLRLAGGSALGVLLTPLPWKLVDDAAIWTQNWSLIPPVPRGPAATKHSVCTLCPANCPVKARCVSGLPVGLAGVPGHPFGDGGLCAAGLAAHHMAYHPSRIDRPWRRVRRGPGYAWEPATGEAVVAMVARCAGASPARAPIAVLDRRPGRCVSGVYRAFLGMTGRGSYLTSGVAEDSTLRMLRRWTSPDPGPLAYDIGNAGVVVSFGVPVLEGWGSPAVTRTAFGGASRPRLVQIAPRSSETSRRADLAVAIRPGSAGAFALGIGALLLDMNFPRGGTPVSGLDDYRRAASAWSPARVAAETGVAEGTLRDVARMLASAGPPLVIGGPHPAGGPPARGEAEAIAALNVLAGAMHVRGGIVPRSSPRGLDAEPAEEFDLCDVAEGSLGLLILDDAGTGLAMPESAIRRSVREGDGLVLAFSPFLAGDALAADVVVPVPAPFESAVDVYSPSTDPRWAMGLAAPLFPAVNPPEGRESFLGEVLRSLDGKGGRIPAVDEILNSRLEAVAASGDGTLFFPGQDGVAARDRAADADTLRAAMLEGAWYVQPEAGPDAGGFRRQGTTCLPPAPGPGSAGSLRPPSTGGDLVALPVGWKGAVGNAAVPPLMSKLYRESDLRRPSGHASVNPGTARDAGLEDAAPARIVTRRGSMEVTVHADPRVMPGVVELSCGPVTGEAAGVVDPLSLFEVAADGSWDAAPARLEAL